VRAASRETLAVVSALGAYLTTVLPRVRRELRRWRKLAEAIPDPERRRQALASLDEKAANVEAVAVFATLAPRRRCRAVLRAIVPLQAGIDYRDTLEEAGRQPVGDDYLAALHAAWVGEIEKLPACSPVVACLRRAVDRCNEGQRHTHAAAGPAGSEPLRIWAEGIGAPPAYRWWEVAAGACSSVAAHALIAAAADPRTTAETAELIDAAYNPPVGALTVFLDDLVDRERDREAGEHSYLDYYGSSVEAAQRLGLIADRAAAAVAQLPRADRHAAILAGVAGFYLSAAEAQAPAAGPIRERLLRAGGPALRLITAFMRVRSIPS
jgi:tetraprenyl-beta-curcumene synthase